MLLNLIFALKPFKSLVKLNYLNECIYSKIKPLRCRGSRIFILNVKLKPLSLESVNQDKALRKVSKPVKPTRSNSE